MSLLKLLVPALLVSLSLAGCLGDATPDESGPALDTAGVAPGPIATNTATPMLVCNGWRDGFSCKEGWCADFDCDGTYHCSNGFGGTNSCCLVNVHCASGTCGANGRCQ